MAVQKAKEVALCVFAQAGLATAQQGIDEVRNSYNFVQAGLSTLAASASAALCIARGRLDSEMALADLFTTTKLVAQNSHGALRTATGNNGSIMAVAVHGINANARAWIGHNSWALGCCSLMVPFWSLYEPTKAQPNIPTRCTCWHVPSSNIQNPPGGRPSVREGPDRNLPQNADSFDPECFRFSSYQCELHGQQHMPDLHATVTPRTLPDGRVELEGLQGPSLLYKWMLDDQRVGQQSTYLFALDKPGARALKRMVSESLATLDSSQKGRTSDLVDWSLDKLDLSEKPDIKWLGTKKSVVLVGMAELVLLFVLACVFGLDPFVSALGARRGVRSLRLGTNGVTQFGDLWLKRVQGKEIQGWNTPILKVQARENSNVSYLDWALKLVGLSIAVVFWSLTVFGLVHPLGLSKGETWSKGNNWGPYVVFVSCLVGLVTSSYRNRLVNFPGAAHRPNFWLGRFCTLQCFVELALTVLRSVPRFRSSVWLLRTWYLVLESGIWLQWCTSKHYIGLHGGPQSDTGLIWHLTLLQAGAFIRAAFLAAVSGKWSR